MKTFTNILSALCIAASLAIIPTILLDLFWVAFILFFAAVILDCISVIVVHSYHLDTRFSHISSNLLVLNTFIALLILPQLSFWWVKIPIILMIGGEAWFASLYEVPNNKKTKTPTTRVSKAANIISLIALAAIFLMGADFWAMFFWYVIGVVGLWVALIVGIWSAIYNYSRK